MATLIRQLATEQNKDKLEQLILPDLVFVEPEKPKPAPESNPGQRSDGEEEDDMDDDYISDEEEYYSDEERNNKRYRTESTTTAMATTNIVWSASATSTHACTVPPTSRTHVFF